MVFTKFKTDGPPHRTYQLQCTQNGPSVEQCVRPFVPCPIPTHTFTGK